MGRTRRQKMKTWDGYRANVELDRGPRGERRRRTVYGKTVAELEQHIAEVKHERATGQILEPSRMTMRKFLEDWLEQIAAAVERSTLTSYQTSVRGHIIPQIGSVRVSQLSAVHVNRVLEAVPGETTKCHVYSVLKRVADRAVNWDLLKANPCDRVDRPKLPQAEMRFLDREQTERFLAAAESDRLHAMYVLAILRGVRQGELWALKPSDVDFTARTLAISRTVKEAAGHSTVGPPKTKASRRTIQLPNLCLDVLHEHQKRRMAEGLAKSEWLFCDRKGGLLRRPNVQRRSFKPLLARAELPPIRFHDLRHTAATLALLAGDNSLIVSQMLGHSNVAFTLQRYGHVVAEMQKESAARIDRMFGGAG